MNPEALHLNRQGAFDFAQIAAFGCDGKGGGYSVRRGAAGAPYAMDESSATLGRSQLTTWATLATSILRAATSVATSTRW
jgi:hypothetical protein